MLKNYILWLSVAAVTLLIVCNPKKTDLTYDIGACAPMEISMLGKTNEVSKDGIVSSSFIKADGSDPPFVRIIRFHVVCEVIGYLQNTIGIVSVVVEFECLGPSCPGGDLRTSVIVVQQFNFACRSADNTYSPPFNVLGTVHSGKVPLANFSTMKEECGACIDPEESSLYPSDPVTFCVRKPIFLGIQFAEVHYS